MVLSMLPSTTARGIGNAMFIGQNLADIHHDIKDKNYTSAGLNTAFTFAPMVLIEFINLGNLLKDYLI